MQICIRSATEHLLELLNFIFQVKGNGNLSVVYEVNFFTAGVNMFAFILEEPFGIDL